MTYFALWWLLAQARETCTTAKRLTVRCWLMVSWYLSLFLSSSTLNVRVLNLARARARGYFHTNKPDNESIFEYFPNASYKLFFNIPFNVVFFYCTVCQCVRKRVSQSVKEARGTCRKGRWYIVYLSKSSESCLIIFTCISIKLTLGVSE